MRSSVRAAALAALACLGSCSSEEADAPPSVAARDSAITQPTPPAPLALPSAPIVAATLAGTLPGQGAVTPTGEYRYDLPLDVPPGRAGMNPSLSLSYGSRGRNGRAGVGWRIGGLSSIEPCPRTFATDGESNGVQLTADDAYCLDGRKLIPIGTATSDGSIEYRTEEDMFARIEALGGVPAAPPITCAGGVAPTGCSTETSTAKVPMGSAPQVCQTVTCLCPGGVAVTGPSTCASVSTPNYWRVWLKNGRVREYDGVGGDVAWPIASEQDRAGNAITYSYNVIETDTSIEWYPTEIDYTAQLTTGEPGRRGVVFGWQARPDPSSERRAYQRFNETVRLASVTMNAPNPTTPSMVWQYTLTYAASPTTHRSLLQSVQRCGALGGCNVPKQFTWASSGFSGFVAGPPEDAHSDQAALVIDVDGDGRDELLIQRGGGVNPTVVALLSTSDPSQPLGAAQQQWVSPDPMSLLDLRNATVGDLNGDGRQELIAAQAPIGACYNSYAYVGAAGAGTWMQGAVLGDYGEYQDPLIAADLDGDGQVDLIGAGYDPAGGVVNGMPLVWNWHYQLNLGGGQFTAGIALPDISGGNDCMPLRASAQDDNESFTTDFGDGRAVSLVCQRSTIPLGVGWNPNATPQGSVVITPAQAISAWADLDGDGIRDAIWFDTLNHGLSVTVSRVPTPDSLFDRQNLPADYTLPLADYDATHYQLAVADFDGDGSEELLLTNATAGTVQLVRYGLSGGAGPSLTASAIDLPVATRLRVGDFNGDGLPDVAAWDPSGFTMTVYFQSATAADYLAYVQDQNTVPNEEIAYSTEWSPVADSYDPIVCQYPRRCMHGGINVVRQRWVWQGNDVDTPQKHVYTYQNPLYDLRGRGFLGFGVVREWEPQRPRETMAAYQLIYAEQGVTPQPIQVRVATPLLTETYAGVHQTPATATARVSLSTYQYQVEDLNGGLTHWIHPTSFNTHEWEEPVSLDWNLADAVHVGNIDGIRGDGAAVDLRTFDGAWTFDVYGNVLDVYTEGQGMARRESAFTYQYNLDLWLVSLVGTETDTSSTSSTPVARHLAYQYNHYGQLLTVSVEQGDANADLPTTTTITRDADGQIRQLTMTAANVAARNVYYDYDHTERVFPTQAWNDLGQSAFVLTHPGYGVPSVVMDAHGTKVTRWFDDLGRIVREIPDGGSERDYAYAIRPTGGILNGGVTVTVSEHAGGATRVSYDELGRAVETDRVGFDGQWDESTTTYDVLGRAVADSRAGVGAPSSYRTQRRFDSLDRPIEIKGPDGTLTEYTQSFLETHRVDPMQHERYVVRDLDGRVVQSSEVHDGSPLSMTYVYGDFDQVTQTTDSKGNVFGITYDRRGRRTKLVDPDAGTTQLYYNGLGDLRQRTLAGASTTYVPDAIGRNLQINSPDGVTTLVWDTSYPGQLTSGTSPDGTVHRYAYDPFGRLSQETWTVGPDTYSFTSTYDGFGRPQFLYYPTVTGRAQLVVQRKYNPAGYLSSVDDVSSGGDHALWTIGARDADGRLTAATFGNGLAASRSYDPATGRLVTLTDGAVLALAYGYDNDGLVTSRSDSLRARGEVFAHGDLHRLGNWNITYAGATNRYAYTYDDLGDLLTVAENGTNLESDNYGINGAPPHALAVSHQGSTTRNFTYDPRGRQTSGDGRSLVTYTDFNLPRTVVTSTGTTTFSYDYAGQRVKKSSPSGATLTLGGLYERRDSGATQEHVFYVLGDQGPIAQVTVAGTTYLHHDHGASVAAATSASGAVVERYDYEPFGARVNAAGAQAGITGGDVKLSFATHRHDDELGLADMKGRVYDPALRHFLTPDPLVSRPLDQQSYNRYSYVRNQPLDLIDPSGFEGEEDDPPPPPPDNFTDPGTAGGGNGGGSGGGHPMAGMTWDRPAPPVPTMASRADKYGVTLPVGANDTAPFIGPRYEYLGLGGSPPHGVNVGCTGYDPDQIAPDPLLWETQFRQHVATTPPEPWSGWLSGGYKYRESWVIAGGGRTAAQAFAPLVRDPNAFFPFKVVGQHGETSIKLGSIYNLVGARILLPDELDDQNYVIVDQLTPTSFRFRTNYIMFDHADATIEFSAESVDGQIIFSQTGIAPSAGVANSLLAPIITYLYAWRLQAERLAVANAIEDQLEGIAASQKMYETFAGAPRSVALTPVSIGDGVGWQAPPVAPW